MMERLLKALDRAYFQAVLDELGSETLTYMQDEPVDLCLDLLMGPSESEWVN